MTITSALLVDDIERLLAGDATAFARLEPVGLVDHPKRARRRRQLLTAP